MTVDIAEDMMNRRADLPNQPQQSVSAAKPRRPKTAGLKPRM